MNVSFFFDPLCPGSWRTSRWLLEVAPERDLTVSWRVFSLPFLNEANPTGEYDDVAEQYREPAQASTRALRLVESLRAVGDNTTIGTFYTELGTRTHDAGVLLSEAIVVAAARAAGIDDLTSVLDDEKWDDEIRESLSAALALAGPGVGSPVLHVEGAARGLYGPVIGSTGDLSADEALTLWDAILDLMLIGAFLEIKRGRS